MEFERARAEHRWAWQWRPALADRRVLIVGYGSIGAAIEARLAPFECEVVRVARRARDGVHPVDDLPRLLPEADVVDRRACPARSRRATSSMPGSWRR